MYYATVSLYVQIFIMVYRIKNKKTCLRLHETLERRTRQNWKNQEMAA